MVSGIGLLWDLLFLLCLIFLGRTAHDWIEVRSLREVNWEMIANDLFWAAFGAIFYTLLVGFNIFKSGGPYVQGW